MTRLSQKIKSKQLEAPVRVKSMGTVITIHPAKRLVVLYLVAYSAVLVLLALGLDYLRQHLGLAMFVIELVWEIALVAGIGHLCFILLRHLTSVFTISSEYVAVTTGILSKHHIRISMNKIVDYRVITPLLERILGLGSIFINTGSNEELMMKHISKDEIEVAVLRLNELLNIEQHTPARVANSRL